MEGCATPRNLRRGDEDGDEAGAGDEDGDGDEDGSEDGPTRRPSGTAAAPRRLGRPVPGHHTSERASEAGPYLVPGLPHGMLELRQALVSHQDYHMVCSS